jgi:uncharacterized membrane protein YdfJ with MMPL/SSD domain
MVKLLIVFFSFILLEMAGMIAVYAICCLLEILGLNQLIFVAWLFGVPASVIAAAACTVWMAIRLGTTERRANKRRGS